VRACVCAFTRFISEAVIGGSSGAINNITCHWSDRSSTIVLIDKHGHGEFIERAARSPYDLNRPKWDWSSHNFTLE